MARPAQGRTRYHFFIDDVDKTALEAIYEADGITPSEQLRRAVKAYLQGRENVKAERKRVAARKRP
jgi:hypothetical protein